MRQKTHRRRRSSYKIYNDLQYEIVRLLLFYLYKKRDDDRFIVAFKKLINI